MTKKRVLALAVGLAAVSAVGAAGGPAHADGFYDAVASGQGVYVTATPGYQALGDTFDGGSIIAQAEISALGTSTAYAAQPYPGAVVNGELAGKYPLYTSSSYPDTPKGSVSNPAATLAANSTQTDSNASASTSVANPATGTTGITSTAEVKQGSDNSLTVTADTVVSGFSLAGVLSLSTIHAHAVFARDATGKVTHDTTLDVGGVTVAGQTVAIGANGVSAAGTSQGLPVSTAVLDSALAAQGLTVSEVAAKNDDGQSLAPLLQITYNKTVPEVGPVSITYNLGFARASIDGTGSPSSDDTDTSTPSDSSTPASTPTTASSKPTKSSTTSVPPVTTGGSGGTGGSVTPDSGTSSASGSLPDTSTGSTGVTSASAPAPSVDTGSTASQGGVTPTAGVTKAAAYRTLTPYSWISLYVIAISASLLAVGGGLLVRHLGVHAR